MSRLFRTEQEFRLPPEDLFPFFADVANLELITPPFLRFEIERIFAYRARFLERQFG